MEKKNLDWENLSFNYMKADKRYVSRYRDGKWDEGGLTEDDTITLSEDAGVFHYSQSVFEGLKAYTTEDGKIVTFRPDLNAQRMNESAERMVIPPLPEGRFMEAVDAVVRANAAWVPPYGTGATLYIRPFIIATGLVIGVKPATEYEFRIFVTPVGPYFKGGAKPIRVKISDYDRAAPRGTGHIKAGLNYGMSLHPLEIAHAEGFAENIFLDAETRTKLEETGGANILLVDQNDRLIVPKSPSILPSITRRSLVEVAKDYLGMEVIERDVFLQEVKDGAFKECGLCGTAAVISPIGAINDHGEEIVFSNGMEHVGPWMEKLYETLTGIQQGHLEAPEGWIHVVA